MISTRQSRELLNELKLAKNKNSLIFVITKDNNSTLNEFLELNIFHIIEINLRNDDSNLLETLVEWETTPNNTVYLVHGISSQFPLILENLNLHRDLFYHIKRPILMIVSEYELKKIQKHAPDLYRFRSRTYDIKRRDFEIEPVFSDPEPVCYEFPTFEEPIDKESTRNKIEIDEYLIKTVSDDYKKAELYTSLGTSYYKLNDFEKGDKYSRKSMEIRNILGDEKGTLISGSRLAILFLSKHQFDMVINISNKLLKLNPNLTFIYHLRGIAYGNLGQHNKAVEDLSKAIERDPMLAIAYINRGIAYGNLGQYDKVVEDLSKAIEINPKSARAYINRSIAYGKLGMYDKAVEDLSKAIEINPKSARAYFIRGIAYGKLGEYDKAVEDCSKAIEIDPKFVEAYINRSIAYRELGQLDKTVKDCSKAIEINPKIVEAYFIRGIAYRELDQYDKAVEDCSKAIEINPKFAEAYFIRGIAYRELDQYDKAVEDCNRAIEIDPKFAECFVDQFLMT
ncbi:MAG: tetratricopeptide repeat protein [Methanotrichaceae archaeon]